MRPFPTAPAAALVVATAVLACTGDQPRSPLQPSSDGEQLALSITPERDTIAVEQWTVLSVRVTDAQHRPASSPVTWRSADPSTASVAGDGTVTGVAVGTARIVAEARGAADTATIVVASQPGPSLIIVPAAASMVLGDTLEFSATWSGTGGAAGDAADVAWLSSDTTVATVDASGMVTSRGVGDVAISAQTASTTGTATITVTGNQIASIAVIPANSTINAGETIQLSAVARDPELRIVQPKSITWSSSAPEVATVSDAGLVTAKLKGVAIIMVKASGRRSSATVTVLGPRVATIVAALDQSTIAPGQTTQANATMKDSAGNVLSDKTVAWQSSNPALATIDASGVVRGVAVGAVTITAISDGKTASTPLTVARVAPALLNIQPENPSATVGQSAPLTAEVRDANGTLLPDRVVSWVSSKPAIATISATGLVSALAVGTSVIRATVDGVVDSVTFTVVNVPVASVRVSPDKLDLTTGATAQLSVTALSASGETLVDRPAAYVSSAAGIATVTATGLVTAAAAGTATITATIEGVSAPVAVTIQPVREPVASIAVSLASTSIEVGKTTQASASVRDAAGNVLSDRTVTWASSDVALATVSASGLVSAVAPGTVTIVATSEGKSGAATLTIQPPPPAPVASVTVTVMPSALTIGQTAAATVVLRDASGAELTGRTVAWGTTAAGVITVSSTGTVTAVGAGTADVTAQSGAVTGRASVSVTSSGGGGACRLVGDHVMRAQPAWPRPGYLAGAADPTYGTLVTRVTGDPGTALGALGPAWQQVNRHNYSKDPAWNADESLLLLKRVLGVGSVLLDGQTYRPLQLVGGGPGETRWHPTLPGVMIYQSAACRAGHWNPRTGAATVLYDASAGYSGCDFGPYEGNASRDGRHVAMHGTRRADGRAVAFVVDLTTGQRWPDVDLAAAGVTSVDWVSVSAGGAYLVVNGGFPGAATCCGGATDGTKVFARDGRLVQTWSEYGRPSHYDLAIDVAGNEVAVGVSKAAPDEGKVIMRRLDTGAATALTAGGYASHTSARNTGRPGWAYVTHTYNGPSWAPYRDEVFAVRLDGTQTIERLANLHTLNSTDYEGQSHAVPSPSGRRVLFASDWESGTNRPVHAYVADARPLCQ